MDLQEQARFFDNHPDQDHRSAQGKTDIRPQRTGLRGRREPLHIEAIGYTNVDTSSSRRLSLLISGSGTGHRIEARTMKNLLLSPQSMDDGDLKNCKHLEHLPITTRYREARPQVLIGQDNWPLLLADTRSYRKYGKKRRSS